MKTALLFLILITTPLAAGEWIDARFRGNVETRVFHHSRCQYFSCGACRQGFGSREEAIAAGYRPCKRCKP